MEPVYVSLEFTPNPNTLKYTVNRTLLASGALNLTTPEEASGKSDLATELFNQPGVSGVMVGQNFVTITKAPEGDWDKVHQTASSAIEAFLTSGRPAVTDAWAAAQAQAPRNLGNTEIERQIIDILDREVRPAVAMDGGDITFERFEGGTVFLHLKGACSGCPSSTMTLKMGVETRLKQAIPEVIEVVAV